MSMTAHREGRLARAIEKRTSAIPSDVFLWAAFGSIAVSLAARLTNRKDLSEFIGLWAPTILTIGVYNKLVKVAGSDRQDAESY